MNNADKFKQIFDLYATELWAMSEKDFLAWLNAESDVPGTNVGDLISRQAAIKDIYELPNCKNGYSDTYDKACLISVLEEQPTIDAVPIVRCKDCKHRPTDTSGHNYGSDLLFPDDYKCPCKCADPYYSWMPKDDWFCANGERREK